MHQSATVTKTNAPADHLLAELVRLLATSAQALAS